MFDRAVKTKLGKCRNCDAALMGAYCVSCGQKAKIELNPNLKDIFHDVFHEVTHVEGKILQSIKLLFSRPGFLTAEYLAGRRAKFVKPLRLYLTASLLFFSLVSATGVLPFKVLVTDPKPEAGASKIAKALQTDTIAGIEKYNSDVKHKEDLDHLIRKTFPRMFLILVPAFALITMVSYGRRRKGYAHYFYFSLHYHSILFTAMALTVLINFVAMRFFKSDFLSLWPLSTSLSVVYFWFAVRKVWNDGWLAATIRTVVVKSLMTAIMAGIIFADVFYYFWQLGRQ